MSLMWRYWTLTLPDGSGLDLCEEIRNRGQHTYIIFITANDKESDMLKGYEVGGADYVTKPFSVTVLCKKVAAVLRIWNCGHLGMICLTMAF